MKKINLEDFILDEIESIEFVGEELTVDITVDETHLFFANDIYTHNSSVNKDDFDLSSISESLGKAQTADVIVGVARTDSDKIAKKAKLMVMKNRNGQDGYSMEMNFDTSKVLIEINSPNDTGILTIDGLDMERRILNG